MSIYLYGPPGSGKSSLGKVLAGRFGLDFIDLDDAIVQCAGSSIPEIFAREGEKGFRARELAALKSTAGKNALVALGGGALLNPEARSEAERLGKVLFLDVPFSTIEKRIMAEAGSRPLADKVEKIASLMAARKSHYDSFALRLVQSGEDACEDLERRADRAEAVLGRFRIVSGDVPSEIFIGREILDTVPQIAAGRLRAKRAVVVADSNTISPWGERVAEGLKRAGLDVSTLAIPAGEEFKNIATVGRIWNAFLNAGLSRSDVAVAVGGGVTGDMTGFAAATWMRGIDWVNVPTSLLSMVDASTGGKTGCDLIEGKNLVGAFHSPRFVFIDPEALSTLPERELACGWAEAVKHAVLAGGALWRDLQSDPGAMRTAPHEAMLSRILAVKVRAVRLDPRETTGERAKLNLGHTFGHALETASGFSMKHGEAVAAGCVMAAKLAARLHPGEVDASWPGELAKLFTAAGLPVEAPEDLGTEKLVPLMARDKKKTASGKIRFVLPMAPGRIRLEEIDLSEIKEF